MNQQKQFPLVQIKTGRSQKQVGSINNQSRLSYLLTSRRAAAAKFVKGFRQTQTKLIQDFPATRKNTSMSVFKESLATLDQCLNSPYRKDKKSSQDYHRHDYCTINPEVITTRKKFIQKHLKTQVAEDSHSNLPLAFQNLGTNRYKKTKPLNSFRSRVGKLNSSVHKNTLIADQSPYKNKAYSPGNTKRMRSQPNVRFTSVMNKKSNLDIEGYEYVKQLGTGGYARVVLAKRLDKKTSGYFAVKIYDKKKTQQKSRVTNIPREIKIMEQIIHPNICRIESQCQTKSTHYIIMEYCGNQSLFRKIGQSEHGYFSEQQAKRYFKKILNAFIYLHQRGIAHRDVKAQNILIHKGDIKLIDFGFSVVPNSTNLIDTYCGTPAYMAPQIFNRTPYNPFYAQIWSLGILLYLMLQGMYPFLTTNQEQLVYKIKKGSYKFIKPISQQSKNLLKWMLNPVPEDRIPLKSIREHSWLQDQYDI